MSRRHAIAGALSGVLALVLSATASAEYRGTDMWSNLMPGDGDGLASRYPLSHYQLDYYVDGASIGLGGVDTQFGAELAHTVCSWAFFIATVVMRCVIAIFDWSFNLNLISTQNGLLDEAATVSQSNYQTIVLPFLTTFIIGFGIWVAVKTVKREHRDTGTAIVRVVLMTAVSLALIYNPQETIGRAHEMAHDLQLEIASLGEGGGAADRVFETFVYKPWAVLQFGGLQVCTGERTDDDDFPLAASKSNPARVCHDVLRKDVDGHGDYARIMLRYAPGTKERKEYYDALREGKPFDQAPAITIDKTDAPAVDMMQAGGAVQRVAFTVLTLIGMAGGILLLGLIAIAILFAQLAMIMLFMLSSFIVLAAIYPGGHGIFINWAKLLGKVLIGGVVFSILLAITLSTSRAIMALGGEAGYFVAFFLQALLFLGVFWKRKALLELATSSKFANKAMESEHKAVSFVAGAATTSAAAVSGGASEFASTMRQGWGVAKAHHSGESSDSGTPDSTSPPASAGRDESSKTDQAKVAVATAATAEAGGEGGQIVQAQQAQKAASTSAPPETMQDQPQTQEKSMPRPFHEDLEQAYARQREPDPPDQEPGQDDEQPYSRFEPATTSARRPSTLQNFEEDLELAMLSQEAPVELPPKRDDER